MTLDILILLIIMTYFVKDGESELVDRRKKHEIVNKIESITWFVNLSKYDKADYTKTTKSLIIFHLE